MLVWITEAQDFIEADIIQWKEDVWEKRGPKQGRSVRVGDRLLTGEVLKEDEETGFVTLLVRDCKISKQLGKKPVQLPIPSGETIRRARKTILIGRPWRLPWSDEEVRARLVAEKKRPDDSGDGPDAPPRQGRKE